VKNSGNNIKPEIGFFLSFGGKKDNNKYVQLEIGHVVV